MWVFETRAPCAIEEERVWFWQSTQSWHHTPEREKWVSVPICNWKSKITTKAYSKFHGLRKRRWKLNKTLRLFFFFTLCVSISLTVPVDKFSSDCDLGGFVWKYGNRSLSSLIIAYRFSSFFSHLWSLIPLSLPLLSVNPSSAASLCHSLLSVPGDRITTIIPAVRYKYALPLSKQHQMTKDNAISITHSRGKSCYWPGGEGNKRKQEWRLDAKKKKTVQGV